MFNIDVYLRYISPHTQFVSARMICSFSHDDAYQVSDLKIVYEAISTNNLFHDLIFAEMDVL